MQTFEDFKTFLKEYKVVTVAIAFVMGAAVNDLVKSFVNNIFMPLLSPLNTDGTWKTASYMIGSIEILWGPFVASLLEFIILAVVVFLVVKKLLHHTPVK